MRWTSLAVLGGLAATGSATTDSSGAVLDLVKPSGEHPEGCKDSYNGKFQIEVEPLADQAATSDKPAPQKRSAGEGAALVMELKDSVLKDAQNRTGYIASNYQFQFDGPPQAGSIYTGGFCVLGNGSLVLGDTTVMYRCKSGDFYNLYDRNWAPQCDAIRIQVTPLSDGGSQDQTNGHSVVGTSMMATTMVTVLPDGQPQVIQTQVPVPICQIGDGQIQAHTTPCAQAPAITSVAPAINPVSQISDGQPQAHPAPPVSQDDDGAPLAPPPQPTATETGSPNEEESAPPPEVTPTPTPETSSAVSPDVESASPTEVATSVPQLETTTRPATTRPATTQPSEQPQAPSISPSSSPVQSGAKMTMPGSAVSLITAVFGLAVFLY